MLPIDLGEPSSLGDINPDRGDFGDNGVDLGESRPDNIDPGDFPPGEEIELAGDLRPESEEWCE